MQAACVVATTSSSPSAPPPRLSFSSTVSPARRCSPCPPPGNGMRWHESQSWACSTPSTTSLEGPNSAAVSIFLHSAPTPTWNPESPQAISGRASVRRQNIDGMKSESLDAYVPAGSMTRVTAALAGDFRDGAGYIHRDGNNPALNVIDNLIAQKKIPVMICVFINPGDVTDAPGTPTYRFVRSSRSMAPHPPKTHAAARNITCRRCYDRCDELSLLLAQYNIARHRLALSPAHLPAALLARSSTWRHARLDSAA